MRVAAIYDIHANLPALEAVLEDIRQAGVDQIVVGGDVLPGPMPRETIARLRHLDIPTQFIHGNGDREVLGSRRGDPAIAVPEQFRAAMLWNAAELDDEDVTWIGGWPPTTRLIIPGLGDVLFCHATPQNDTDIFTRLTADERLRPVFGRVDAAVVVCGHTHMPFDRLVGRTRVVNAGSVGMPFGRPGADWLLLGPGIEFRHTPYDLDLAAARIRATDYPQADEFAARHVLQPPSEESILQAFARSELKE